MEEIEIEKDFLKEIKPLVEDYIEKQKIEIPSDWYDKEERIKIETNNGTYSNDREGEILRQLNEKVRVVNIRRELIKELKQIQADRKNEIYAKTEEFISNTKENALKGIEDNKQKLEEIKNKVVKAKKDKKIYMKIMSQVDKNSKIYKAASEENIETITQLKEYAKQETELKTGINKNEEIIEKIEEEYGTIELEGENGIYTLYAMIGRQEEKESMRMSDGQLFDENNKVIDTIGDAIDQAENVERNQEQNLDKRSEQNLDRNQEQNLDKRSGQNPDRISGQNPDKKLGQNLGENLGRNKSKITYIEMNASTGKVIVTYEDQSIKDDYSISELLKQKEEILKFNGIEEKSKLTKKVNPIIIAILDDNGEKDAIKQYINGLKGIKQDVEVPSFVYDLKKSILSKKENRILAKFAKNEKSLLENNVIVEKESLWNRLFKKTKMIESKSRENVSALEEKKINDKEVNQQETLRENLSRTAPTQEEQAENAKKFNEQPKNQKTKPQLEYEVMDK